MSDTLRTRHDYLKLIGTPNAMGELSLDIREGSIPAFLPDKVLAVVGVTATVLHKDDATQFVGLLVENGSFQVRTGDQLPRVVTRAGVNLSSASHGYDDDHVNGPVTLTTTDTLPSPLAVATLYWICVVDENTVSLHSSRLSAEKALAGEEAAGRIELTDAGVGTHTLGGFPAEAAATDVTVGHNTVTIGTGPGQSATLAVFHAFRARAVTVKGGTAQSRLKAVVTVSE
jgi:hypothetical protein